MARRETNRQRQSLARLDAAKARQGGGSVDDRLLTLSTGVVLEILLVPPMLLSDIAVEGSKAKPEPPVAFVASLGREEENPDDPVYREAIKEWTASVMVDINNTFVLMGTKVHSTPKGFPGPDDQRWLDTMRLLRRPVDNASERYLSWIKYAAGPGREDVTSIVREVGRLAGVGEADVKQAIDAFPSDTGGAAPVPRGTGPA